MIFPSLSTTVPDTSWVRAEPVIPWLDMLYFSTETQGVLTPFRERVLSYIYRTSRALSGGLLESALVEAVREPDEEDSLHLNLAMTFKMDWDELDKLHDQILAKVAEWSGEWSFESREEYGRWIFFSLMPSEI